MREEKRQRKDIVLNLTDRRYGILHGIAYEYGFSSPAELLEGFVADLTRSKVNNTDSMFEAVTWLNMAFGSRKAISTLYFRQYLYDEDIMPRDIADASRVSGFEDIFKQIYKDYIETGEEKKHQSQEECRDILREWSNEPTKGTNPGTEAHHPGTHAYS